MIPVLLYHHIGEPEERWQRTPENLRKDLEMLYEKGYRPVHVKDLVNRTIDLPAGTSPFVLTFDDSSASQFKVLGVENGKPIIDPKSALGIMEQFAKEHPDFGMTATFFIPPLADPPNRLFNQPEYNELKMEYLVEHGYEIGNHTFFHQRLDMIESPWVERQIALGKSVIESYIPGYDVNVFALPLGMWPEPRQLAIEGSWGDENNPTIRYKNIAVMEAQGPPAVSPYDGDWNPHSIPRVQALQHLIDETFSSLESDPKLPRYVSDGDPNTVTFPKRYADWLNPAALGGARPVER